MMDDLFTTDWSVLAIQTEPVAASPSLAQPRQRVPDTHWTVGWQRSEQDRAQRSQQTRERYANNPHLREAQSQRNRESWQDSDIRSRRLAGLQRYVATGSAHRKKQQRLAMLRRFGLSTDFPGVVTPAGEFWTWQEAERAMGITGAKRRKLQQQHPELYYIKQKATK